MLKLKFVFDQKVKLKKKKKINSLKKFSKEMDGPFDVNKEKKKQKNKIK